VQVDNTSLSFADTDRFLAVEDYTKGVSRLAALLDSDPDLAIYRTFGAYAALGLLRRQFEINKLVTKLDEMDKADTTSKRFSLEYFERADKDGNCWAKELDTKIWEFCEPLS
jgi:hypothetical protein